MGNKVSVFAEVATAVGSLADLVTGKPKNAGDRWKSWAKTSVVGNIGGGVAGVFTGNGKKILRHLKQGVQTGGEAIGEALAIPTGFLLHHEAAALGKSIGKLMTGDIKEAGEVWSKEYVAGHPVMSLGAIALDNKHRSKHLDNFKKALIMDSLNATVSLSSIVAPGVASKGVVAVAESMISSGTLKPAAELMIQATVSGIWGAATSAPSSVIVPVLNGDEIVLADILAGASLGAASGALGAVASSLRNKVYAGDPGDKLTRSMNDGYSKVFESQFLATVGSEQALLSLGLDMAGEIFGGVKGGVELESLEFPPGHFIILNVQSGNAVTVSMNAPQMASYEEGNVLQHWKYDGASGAIIHTSSAMALDHRDGWICLAVPNGRSSQRWIRGRKLAITNSETDKALDICEGIDKTRLCLWPLHNDPNQQFKIVPVKNDKENRLFMWSILNNLLGARLPVNLAWPQLVGVQPVHILVGGGTHAGKKFLTCTPDGQVVHLCSHDDKSGRQQWLLKPIAGAKNMFNIVIKVGNHADDGGRRFLSCHAHGHVDLWTSDDGSGRQWWFVNGDNIFVGGGTDDGKKLLSCVADGEVELFAVDDGSKRQQWTLEPVEEQAWSILVNKKFLTSTSDGQVYFDSHGDKSGHQQWLLKPIAGAKNTFNIVVRRNNADDKGQRFLGCHAHGHVHLCTGDDGSGRQRWFVDGSNIFVCGGTDDGKKLLSCTPDGKVELSSVSDGSNRQKWILEPFLPAKY